MKGMFAGIASAALIAGLGGGGPPAGPSATQWRINMTARQTAGNFFTLREVEMFSALGGADLCTGGTASAQFNNGTAGNLFDNSDATTWASGNSTLPSWIGYTFASPVTVEAVSFTIHTNIGDAPTAFDVQYFDGTTWVTYWSYDNTPITNRWFLGATKRVFVHRATAGGGAYYWRVNVTTSQSGTGSPSATEIEWHNTAGGPDLSSPDNATPFSNSIGTAGRPDLAMDDNLTTKSSSSATPQAVGYRFNTKVNIIELKITGSGTAGDNFKNFTVDRFDEATQAWVTVATFTNISWTASEVKTFSW